MAPCLIGNSRILRVSLHDIAISVIRIQLLYYYCFILYNFHPTTSITSYYFLRVRLTVYHFSRVRLIVPRWPIRVQGELVELAELYIKEVLDISQFYRQSTSIKDLLSQPIYYLFLYKILYFFTISLSAGSSTLIVIPEATTTITIALSNLEKPTHLLRTEAAIIRWINAQPELERIHYINNDRYDSQSDALRVIRGIQGADFNI